MTRDQPLRLDPVGVVDGPYESPADAPHQGFADDAEAVVEVFPAYEEALAGLADVHRLVVLYWAHEADRAARPDPGGSGAFARRGPTRPNPVCLCTCLVLGVEGRRIRVRGLDAVDGSPVVDLKPALRPER